MLCDNCGSENLDRAKFCIQCGLLLRNICQTCGATNPGKANFCAECGAKLREIKQDPINKKADIENRQLTILFCDIVDYTQLAELLDPEDLHDVVRLYQETCAEVVNQFDGHIAKYLGDGLLIYFGYPVAHEDDAQRGAKAGLQILNAISELRDFNKRLPHTLQVRIGIHTGQVMAGEMGVEGARETLAVLGETPNIASRLMNVALPNTVVISSTTFKLVEDLFTYKDMGMMDLKGVSNRIQVYQVLEETNLVNRFELARKKGLTPFVGRHTELELLFERWEHARAGYGQIVLISGEGGIGKSRLVQAFKELLSKEQYLKIESHCSAYNKNSAFFPLIDNLNRSFFLGNTDNEEKISILEKALLKHDFPVDQMISLLAPLLSIPIPEIYSPLNLNPEIHKQKTMEALLNWSIAEAERQPVLRIFEDLQWVDPSTLDYLGLLMDQLPQARILLLLTFRPDFQPPWKMRSFMTHISLNRLTRNQMDEMVNSIGTSSKLPSVLEQQIIDRADGIPLFIEELYKMISESVLPKQAHRRDHVIDPGLISDIPMTLKDSLMARLDALGTAKELAQLAGTLGREFSYDQIRAASSLDENTLKTQLDIIIESDILFLKGMPPYSRYIFKHHLIQDAAYQSMPKRKRQQFHNKIANMLEEKFPETVNSQPELIALHFTNAGKQDRAVYYWQIAGKRAIERSAHVEAINHLKEGLKILERLSDARKKDEYELECLILLGTALRVTKGFSSTDVQNVYLRARDLSKRVRDEQKLLPVLRGLCGYYLGHAEFSMAYELGAQYLNLAESARSTIHKVQAHYILGAAQFCKGEFVSSREQTERGLEIYNTEQHTTDIAFYGHDPGVGCLFWASSSLWFLGYVDGALNKAKESLELAKRLTLPFSLAAAYNHLALIQNLRGNSIDAYKSAEDAIALSTERGFEFFLGMGRMLLDWSLVEQGKRSKSISVIKKGFERLVDSGANILRSYWIALLAESYLNTGKIQAGLNLLGKYLDGEEKNEEEFYNSELYRVKGELLMATSPKSQPEAEVCFRRAVKIAREQNAKSLELRSAISLCHLLQLQSKEQEAGEILSEIYNWFSEGFDTRDLTEAKILLDNLP